MRRLNKRHYKNISIIFGLFLIFVFLGFIFIFQFTPLKSAILKQFYNHQSTGSSLLTRLITDDCNDKGRKKINCYDTKLTELSNKVSMEKAFEVTKNIQAQDKDYAYCHVVAHKIASEEVQKDPSAWKTVIPRCPVNQCANGCIHGVFQERFKAESLSSSQIDVIKAEFKEVCNSSSWNPTFYEQTSCYHALGHLFVYMSKADMNKSVSLCQEITEDKQDMTRYCYEGAFMQVFQVLEPDDEILVKEIKPRSQKEAVAFCAQYGNDGLVQVSCINQSWPLYINKLKNDPTTLLTLCNAAENTYHALCEGTIISVMPIQFQFDEKKLLDYCSAFPQDYQQICFNIIASRMISSDGVLRASSIRFCEKVPRPYMDGCFVSLLNILKSDKVFTEENKKNICGHFPADYKYACLY